MQDRTSARSTKPSCNSRPDHTTPNLGANNPSSGRIAKLGSGARFAALKSKLGGRKGSSKVSNPAALAAFIDRKKYGEKTVRQALHQAYADQ